MNNFASNLRKEIKRIEQYLQGRSRKLDLLKTALLHYESLNEIEPKSTSKNNGQTKAEVVRKNVLTLLKEGPKHRQDILKELASRNLLKPSDDGMNYLASHLSTWEETESNGHGTWFLSPHGSRPSGGSSADQV